MYTGPACQQKCCLYNQKHHTLPLQNVRLAKEVTHTIHERGLDILVSRKKDPYSCQNLDGYQVVCPSHFRTNIPFLENKLKRKKCSLELRRSAQGQRVMELSPLLLVNLLGGIIYKPI